MTRIEADWLRSDATQQVLGILESAGHQAFAVGGCVRDAILGRAVSDIDVATSAIPEDVIQIAKASGLRVVPTGVDHGTVTVLVDDVPYEVTTFRRDVETDGRRAVVRFAEDIGEDARRRDFTMNALYCDARGEVHDPLSGLVDLAAGRVRFIEDANLRIREDYLRSLRYFRFHAWYGNPDGGLDADAMDAIGRNVDGLVGLSRERVGSEVKRLLSAPHPVQAVAGMRATGVLNAVLPGADDRALGVLVAFEQEMGVAPDAVRRLAVLGGDDVADRLRLSNKEARKLQDIRQSVGWGPGAIGYRLGADVGLDALLVAAATMGAPIHLKDIEKLHAGAAASFPVTAADLMPDFTGPALGQRLKALEARWIESEFSLGREELLSLGG